MYQCRLARPTARRSAAGLAVASLVPVLLAAGGGPAMAATGPATSAASGTISTVAGGIGGPATGTSVTIGNPFGVTYANGSLYVADGPTVRKLNAASGYLTNVVGDSGYLAPMGANGSSSAKAHLYAEAAAVDQAGNVLIDDAGHYRIRVAAQQTGTFYGKAMKAGHIYTIAGDGSDTVSGNGGLATAAGLGLSLGLTTDSHGNIVVAVGSEIRVVAAATGTFYGQAMTAGDIYDVAGGGSGSTVGGPATSFKLHDTVGVAVDAAGNLLFTSYGGNNNLIWAVAASTGMFYGQAMTAGDIYLIGGGGSARPGGGLATKAALYNPSGITVDAAGNVVLTDTNLVMVVAAVTGTFYGQAMTAGHVYPLTDEAPGAYNGDGKPAIDATTNDPFSVTTDSHGNVVFADRLNDRVRVIAATSGTFYGQAMQAGYIYTVAGNAQSVSGGSGLATRAVLALGQGYPGEDCACSYLTQDPANGNVLFSAPLSRLVQVVAGQTGTFFGRKMTAGHLYAVAGNGALTGSTANGARATAEALPEPGGVALDAAGNLLIAVTGERRVRVVAATTGTFYGRAMTAGHIYTIAGGGSKDLAGIPATEADIVPDGVTVDAHGNVLIATGGLIQVVPPASGTFYGQAMTAGDIYDVAGGGKSWSSGIPAGHAYLDHPGDVAVDAAGNLLVANSGRRVIQVVAESSGTFYGTPMTAGDIYTLASEEAAVSVVADAHGNLVFGDGVSEVRVIAGSTGTFYGQAMTAGDLYTIAGTSTEGYSGDGGPATSAELSEPAGVAVESDGNVVVADQLNGRIRLISY